MKAVNHIGSAFLRQILLRMKELGMNKTALAKKMRVSRPYVTAMELAGLLQMPKRTVERKMSELRASGVIRRIGARKNGYWECVEAG